MLNFIKSINRTTGSLTINILQAYRYGNSIFFQNFFMEITLFQLLLIELIEINNYFFDIIIYHYIFFILFFIINYY